jgi:hypothetical protein
MSIWLSSANKLMDSTRAQTTAAAKRQVASIRAATSGIGPTLDMSAQLLPVPLEKQSHSQRRLPRHIGFIPDGNRR